jgi:hypothetical protein
MASPWLHECTKDEKHLSCEKLHTRFANLTKVVTASLEPESLSAVVGAPLV